MKKRAHVVTTAFVGLISAALAVSPARSQGVPPAPPPLGEEPAIEVAPGVPDVMRREGLGQTEARAVLDRQGAIARFLNDSGITRRDDFVDLIVRPKPY